MANPSKFATSRHRADNASASRTSNDPRRALVRLLAELIVEDYMAERQSEDTVAKNKIEEEE